MHDFLPLKDGYTYQTGRGIGHDRTVVGTCQDHADWCYTREGWWYERATGRAIGYHPHHGYIVAAPSINDIVRDKITDAQQAETRG